MPLALPRRSAVVIIATAERRGTLRLLVGDAWVAQGPDFFDLDLDYITWL